MSLTAPLISVCMPIYNSASYVAEAIESVLAQTFHDFELLITDDGSSDGTAEIAAEYASRDGRIRLRVNRDNVGMVANWNGCLTSARGPYVKFLFGDDLLAPDALARMSELLERDPQVSLVASGRTVIDDSSRPVDTWVNFASGTFRGTEVIRRCLDEQDNLVGEPSAVMFRKSDAGSGFDPGYKQIVDMELWFRLLEQGNLGYLADTLCSFRRHSDQQTSKNQRELIGFSEIFPLSASYLRKPYLGYAEKDVDRFLFQKYYRFWKMFRNNPELAPKAADIIDTQFGRAKFRRMMLLYKLSNPCKKLLQKVAGPSGDGERRKAC